MWVSISKRCLSPWTGFFRSGISLTLAMMLGLSIVKLSLCIEIHFNVSDVLCLFRSVIFLSPWTRFFRSGISLTLSMVLGLSIVKLSLCLEIHFTVSDVLCQYILLRIFSSGTVPMYTTTSQWHCASVHLYVFFLVALCQSMPLYLSRTVPMNAYISVALCQCMPLYLSGTVPMHGSIP